MIEIHYTASWTYSVDGDVRNTPCGEDAVSPAQEREEREEAEYAADLAAGRI